MSALRTALLLAATLATVCAAEHASAQAPQPLVFVFDRDGTRLGDDAVRLAVASALHRSILRVGDARAADASAMLIVAHARPREWIIVVAHGSSRIERRVRLTVTSPASLARAAALVVAESELGASDWPYAVDADPVDAFRVGAPGPSQLRRVEELADPFAGDRVDALADPWAATPR